MGKQLVLRVFIVMLLAFMAVVATWDDGLGPLLRARETFVLIDNAGEQKLAVSVDGQPALQLAPNRYQRVDLAPGAHQLRVQDESGKVLEEGSFSLPRDGMFHGTHGLYNILGRGRYAQVAVSFSRSGSTPPSVEPISPAGNFMELPARISPPDYDTIDVEFPAKLMVQGSASRTLIHLCHLQVKKQESAAQLVGGQLHVSGGGQLLSGCGIDLHLPL